MEGLAELHTHLGGSVSSDILWTLAHEPGTVWEYSLKTDLPAGLVMPGSQSNVRLANGNTVICSRGGNGAGLQLIEVTPAKKIVWALYDWKTLGPATAVQMLDDPCIPEKPGDCQR